MSDAPHSDAVTLLVFALDEMRETTSLLPVESAGVRCTVHGGETSSSGSPAARLRSPPGSPCSTSARTSTAAATIGERAVVTGRTATRAWRQRSRGAPGWSIEVAGVNGVLGRLQHHAIPRPIAKTAVHLAEVVATIRDCDHVVLDPRNKLALQRMRSEEV